MTWLERTIMAVLEAATMLGAIIGTWLVYSSLRETAFALAAAGIVAVATTLIPLAITILAHNNIMRRIQVQPLDAG